MSRNPKIKLKILSEKQLNKKVNCSKCNDIHEYKNMYFYVDESNISITNNSKPVCKNCKK